MRRLGHMSVSKENEARRLAHSGKVGYSTLLTIWERRCEQPKGCGSGVQDCEVEIE